MPPLASLLRRGHVYTERNLLLPGVLPRAQISVVPIGWPPRSPFLSWSSRGSDFATAAEKMAVIMTRLLGAELERTRGRRRSALVSLLTQLPERVEHYYQWVRSFVRCAAGPALNATS